MRRFRALIVPLAAAALLANSCGDLDNGGGGRVRVVTTLPLFADFVREIGGDRVNVASLLPSGADPHTWEPSPRDVQRVAEADLVFANGLDLEPEALKVIQANADPSAVVLIAPTILGPAGSNEGVDPHVWMDPEHGMRYASVVRDRLLQADPGGAGAYAANLERFVDDIAEAQAYVRQKVASVPEDRRKLVTTHDAFGRFAEAFGLEVVAFVAPGPGQEASPEDVADIARAIEREGVPAVFAEPQTSAESDILRRAAEDAGVQVCTLYSDSLDDKVTGYIDMLRFNADELARCLGDGDGG
jgi:zinc/manganese transport system substrate-binding protein